MYNHYQINLVEEPQHPVWKIILLKQCCGLISKYSNTRIVEYQWFKQISFSHFCPGLYLNEDQIIKFEHTFQMKYSPQGPCLSLVNNELKIELILISISLGFSILLMLLTWLFIWQDRLIYLELFKNILQKQKKNSIISTNKSSITSVMGEPDKVEIPPAPVVDSLDQSNEVETPKISETKRLYQGYLTALVDVQ